MGTSATETDACLPVPATPIAPATPRPSAIRFLVFVRRAPVTANARAVKITASRRANAGILAPQRPAPTPRLIAVWPRGRGSACLPIATSVCLPHTARPTKSAACSPILAWPPPATTTTIAPARRPGVQTAPPVAVAFQTNLVTNRWAVMKTKRPVLEATPEPDTSNPKEPTSTTMMAHHPRFRVSVWPVTTTISVPVQRLIVQVFLCCLCQ